MKQYIYIYSVENGEKNFLYFLKKRRRTIIDGLSEAAGIYKRCLRNIHTEFLANDGKFLSLIKYYTTSRIKINTDFFSREAIQIFFILLSYSTTKVVSDSYINNMIL